jgi:hypothetical protein
LVALPAVGRRNGQRLDDGIWFIENPTAKPNARNRPGSRVAFDRRDGDAESAGERDTIDKSRLVRQTFTNSIG